MSRVKPLNCSFLVLLLSNLSVHVPLKYMAFRMYATADGSTWSMIEGIMLSVCSLHQSLMRFVLSGLVKSRDSTAP